MVLCRQLYNTPPCRFETAPGSKLLLKGSAQVNQGIVLLNNGNCKLLGGRVEHMYEKWKLNKVNCLWLNVFCDFAVGSVDQVFYIGVKHWGIVVLVFLGSSTEVIGDSLALSTQPR